MQGTDQGVAAAPRRTLDVLARGALGVAAALAANLAVRALLVAALDVERGFDPLQLRPVALTTLVSALLGVVVALVLSRLTARPARWFALAALGAGALSYALAATMLLTQRTYPGTTAGTVLALLPLHLLPAASLVLALGPVLRRAPAD